MTPKSESSIAADPERLLDEARTIVCDTPERGGPSAARDVALRTAARTGARVILYPLDAASMVSNPMPSNWSAEGTRDQYGDPLAENDLELLGRDHLAEQLREVSRGGIQVAAWLPEEPGVDAMAAYAERHDAGVVLIPDDLEDPSLIDRLKGQDEPSDVEEERTAVSIITVGEDGSLSLA